MPEYISKESVLLKCADIWDNADETTQTGVDTINTIDKITDFIESLPAADVQPVRRGRWIEKSEDYYSQWQDSGRSWDDMPYFITGEHFACGVCFDKYEINAEGVEFWDFCPHCGADMRGGAENDD